MKRRRFLQLGAVSGTLATMGVKPVMGGAYSTVTETRFDLTIEPANTEMIDGRLVYTLNYFRGLANPNPELRVKEGDEITITVTNNDTQPHSFYITGIPESHMGRILPGQTGMATFDAPRGGTYLYVDAHKSNLNRMLGLHGAFIVEPKDGKTAAGTDTPYSQSQHTPQLQALFDAFGNHPQFPGDAWVANDLRHEKLWLFSQVDPTLNDRVAAGETVDPKLVRDNFLPQYFTINGLSGFDTAQHEIGSGHNHTSPSGRIMPSARQGQPCLIRCINAGLASHACHIHGNHCLELAESHQDFKNLNFDVDISGNIYEVDTWHLRPFQRIDLILPFRKPPDIPDECWPPREEPFPLRYVMHCHFEISQTAAGGNYPQGAVTHWEMTAPL